MKNFLSGLITVSLIAATATATYAQVAKEDRAKRNEQTTCMALNIYYEARGSNLADQAAVADVVLNRVYDTRYPNSICGVVQDGKQNSDGSMVRDACQFSWYCDGKSDKPRDLDRWNEAQMIAYNMVNDNKYRGITEGSTHYHATYVNPYWASSLQMVGRIGAHIFYRWED